MLLVFPITRHLEEKSLEGMSIIVCVRWMLFAPISFGIVVAISIALTALYPEANANTINEHYLLPMLVGLYFLLVVRDVWLVRRVAMFWEESRIRSLKIMRRLPMVLLILVPVFLIAESPRSTGPVIEWISGMLWVFSCLSVLFYLVYFTLLLSVFRLPKLSAIFGFLLVLFSAVDGTKDRIKDDSASLQTTVPSRVQVVMTTTDSIHNRSLASGQT